MNQCESVKKEIPSYTAPALEKGLAILELLARHGATLSARRIAEELGRSKSEIFRVVHVLIAHGYLLREAEGDGLMLSNRLFSLGMRTTRARGLVSVAAPIVERFAEQVGQAAHLVVAHRGETVVIASSSGGADMNFSLKLGYHRPLTDAHSGLVLMAFQPDAVRDRMLTEGIALMDDAPESGDIVRELTEIRRAGFLIAESRDVLGVTDIACPILTAGGRAVACITVAALTRRAVRNRFDAVLNLQRHACKQIADRLDVGADLSIDRLS